MGLQGSPGKQRGLRDGKGWAALQRSALLCRPSLCRYLPSSSAATPLAVSKPKTLKGSTVAKKSSSSSAAKKDRAFDNVLSLMGDPSLDDPDAELQKSRERET